MAKSVKSITIAAAVFLVVAYVGANLAWFFGTSDTYTATVEDTWFIDSVGGKTQKFIRVKPQTESWIRGVDNTGALKVTIVDSHVPYFAWATNGDRANGLSKGQIICLSDTGYRSEWFSKFPNLISYTDGACK